VKKPRPLKGRKKKKRRRTAFWTEKGRRAIPQIEFGKKDGVRKRTLQLRKKKKGGK